MLIQKTPPGAQSPADEWRVLHEWFAGWRWERYRAGELVDESPQSFATRDECVADARARWPVAQESPSGEPEGISAISPEPTQLAA